MCRVGGEERQFSYKRSSKVGYIADSEPGIAKGVSRRIEMLTSYNVVNNHVDRDRQSSEDFQVTYWALVTEILLIKSSGHELWTWGNNSGTLGHLCHPQGLLW